MTVISAIITRQCIAVSTDSLLTAAQDDGTREPREWKQSKIIPIPKFGAAASYWGRASYGRWSTYDWLRSQAKQAESVRTFEEFANSLRDSLEAGLSRLSGYPHDHGIGIHLTGYERIDDYWIPELFLCTNFQDTSYSRIADHLRVSRESYKTAFGESSREEHGEPEYRKRFHQYLQDGGMLIFNNGDPAMFNPAANSILAGIRTLRQRGVLIEPDNIDTYRSMAKRPIEIVSALQRDLCLGGYRVVGGKIHDLIITPDGRYFSDSGDDRP